jgi:hypothetical protein
MGEDAFYYYFGIESQLKRIFENSSPTTCIKETISINVSADGLPISKSSDLQFWPIQGMINNLPHAIPFIIGLYYGRGKPVSLETYLSDFIIEVKKLEEVGLLLGNNVVNFRVNCIIADAPARAFLKGCKNHNAYYGCERCTVKGKYFKRVVFLSCSSSRRTDSTFRGKLQAQHHNEVTPLVEIKIDLVLGIPLDYMHLVCLGIMKKLLKCWVSGPHRVQLKHRKVISEQLILLKEHTPGEFSRKPRELKFVNYFKATEFRLFLLYTGIVVLKGALDDIKYKHFLTLQCAIYILLLESDSAFNLYDKAEELLLEFVRTARQIYGKEFIVYNVHSLIHLADDARIHGSLDNISAFPYENNMQQILKFMRGNNKLHLQQVVNRIYESQNIKLANVYAELNPCKVSNGKVIYKNVVVSFKKGDNCFLTDMELCVVVTSIYLENEIIKIRYLTCEVESFREYPLSSKLLNIYHVNGFKRSQIGNITMLARKCLLLPTPKHGGSRISFICIPFTKPL